MLALHQVGGRDGHVVAKIVETELIVGSEGDIGLICPAALLRVGTMLIDAVYTQSIEHIERSHPLRVTLGEVVVYRHHVYTVASQCVEEYGQGGHQGLTLTRGHLGYLALVQGDTAKELYIVVYHIPFHLVAAGSPLVVVDGFVAVDGDEVVGGVGSQLAVKIVGRHYGLLVFREASGGVFDDAESYGHHFVECLLVLVEGHLLNVVDFVEYLLTLVDGCVLDGGAQLVYFLALLLGRILHVCLYLLGLGTQFVVAKRLDRGVDALHRLYKGLYQFHVTGGFVTKQ